MSDLNQIIEWNKQNAYSGELGRRRELFCQDYIQQKKVRIKDLEQKQRAEVESNKAEITCEKQCRFSSCCMEYIEATIQECDTIVYYLYKNNEAFSKFLKNYPGWRERVASCDDIYKECEAIYETLFPSIVKKQDFRLLEDIDQKYLDFHMRYFDLHIPCPFSCDNECLIYEVRPFSCAGSYSTSPLELCGMIDKIFPPINRSEPPDDALSSSFYYGTIQAPRPLFMPLTVYEI